MSNRSAPPWPLVLVRWEDSAQPRPAWEWLDAYELEASILCVSVGYLVAETERAIALAPNVGDLDHPRAQVSGIMRIPRSAIRATYFLKAKSRTSNVGKKDG